MKKAWSFFWLVIAAIVAVCIVAAMIQPWLPVILITFVLVIFSIVGIKGWRFIRHRRRFF